MFAGPRALSRTLQSQERVAERALHFLVGRKQREEKGAGISVTQESYDQLSAQYNPREDALLTNFTTTKPHVLKFPEPSKMGGDQTHPAGACVSDSNHRRRNHSGRF